VKNIQKPLNEPNDDKNTQIPIDKDQYIIVNIKLKSYPSLNLISVFSSRPNNCSTSIKIGSQRPKLEILSPSVKRKPIKPIC
jgi:hypothetical protein